MSNHTETPAHPPKESAIKKMIAQMKNIITSQVEALKTFLKGGPKNIIKIPVIIAQFPFLLVSRFFKLNFYLKVGISGFILGIFLVTYSSKHFFSKVQLTAPKVEKRDLEKEKIEELMHFNEELKKVSSRTIYLERFTTHLIGQDGNLKEYELELFLTCDTKESKAWLKVQMDAVKEIVSLVLETKKYEEMLNEDGKEDFKQKVMKSINQFYKKKKVDGKVERVFFGQLTMES